MSPLAFLLRRVGARALTVLAVASLSFVAIHALPGDPADVLLDVDVVPLRARLATSPARLVKAGRERHFS